MGCSLGPGFWLHIQDQTNNILGIIGARLLTVGEGRYKKLGLDLELIG